MQAPNAHGPSFPLRKTLIAATLAAIGCGAFAQEEGPATNYLGLRETVGRTSNVFVIPDGPHDYFYSTSLLGGLDKTYSRQHLHGIAEVDDNRYHNAKGLNNTGYSVQGGWDWATIEKLSGSVTGIKTQNLASLSGNASIPTTERNLAKTGQIAASLKYGGEGLLSFEGGIARSRVSYSAPDFITQESSANTANVGAFYRAGPTLRLGLAGRFTRVEQPNAVPIAGGAGGYQSETTDGKNLDLTAEWLYSVQTNVNARISYTRQTFSGAASGDGFSGLTGALYANYAPSSKLYFSAALLRDAGINSGFFNVINPPTTATGPSTTTVGLTESSQVTNTASLAMRYAATAKISGNLGYQYRKSKTNDTQGLVGPTDDKLQATSVGLTYDVDRNWQLACAYSHQSRDVTGTGPFTYIVNTTSCYAQFLLR